MENNKLLIINNIECIIKEVYDLSIEFNKIKENFSNINEKKEKIIKDIRKFLNNKNESIFDIIHLIINLGFDLNPSKIQEIEKEFHNLSIIFKGE